MGKDKLLNVETINAAVAGEAWAVEKVVEHYAGEINRLCTVEKKQPNGRIEKVIDEDMRQAITLKFIQSLSSFDAE